MKYVTFSGGFHNVEPIRVRVNEQQHNDIKDGEVPLPLILSDYQMKRLEKHFCGVDGCCCGGVSRATIEL